MKMQRQKNRQIKKQSHRKMQRQKKIQIKKQSQRKMQRQKKRQIQKQSRRRRHIRYTYHKRSVKSKRVLELTIYLETA
jgi:hypothetical protein